MKYTIIKRESYVVKSNKELLSNSSTVNINWNLCYRFIETSSTHLTTLKN